MRNGLPEMNDHDKAARRSFLLCITFMTWLLILLMSIDDPSITGFYFVTQDMWVCLLLTACYIVAILRPPGLAFTPPPPGRRLVWLAAAALVLLLWLGTHAVMLDYPLTRDEHMAVFDSYIYGHLRLAWPLAPEWRPFSLSLVPAFLLDVPGHALLVSAYGPVNAMFRAAFGAVLDPALMNPLLAGIGLIALYRIAARLFPHSPGAVWTTLIGYVLSAQILVNAMTTYAMTAHLALNLVWLALYLHDRRWSHGVAMAIGVLAIGLHQIIFHPLFAGPFILVLLARRRWGLFALYAAVYGAALLFWMKYPAIVMAMGGITPEMGSGAGAGGFLAERIMPLLVKRDPFTFPLMLFNLSRLAAWSPVFLLPLVVMSWSAVKGNRGIALPLFSGVLLTLVAMAVILPMQGHGWGYRYLHPVMGNFLLLAGYGYQRWSAQNASRANGTVLLGSAVTLLLIIPFLLVTSHRFIADYVNLLALVNRQDTDMVIIDTEKPSFAIDIVRNLPDLTNRPLLLSSREMSEAQVSALCQRGSIALVTRKDFHRIGVALGLPVESPAFERLTRPLQGQECLRPARD